jgi:hypothetical protein
LCKERKLREGTDHGFHGVEGPGFGLLVKRELEQKAAAALAALLKLHLVKGMIPMGTCSPVLKGARA